MGRIIFITFGCLGWAWFEMSGGSDFEAGQNGVTVMASFEPVEEKVAVKPVETQVVARADTTQAGLNTVSGPRLNADLIRISAPVAPDAAPVAVEKVASLTDSTVQTDAIAIAAADYRIVTGNRVNLRGGPSTNFGVVTKLTRGEEVEVLMDEGDGWVKLRALDGNDIGWMSADFLRVASN